MSWDGRFAEPIVLLDGIKLVTLLDAATYATELPKKKSNTLNGKPRLKA